MFAADFPYLVFVLGDFTPGAPGAGFAPRALDLFFDIPAALSFLKIFPFLAPDPHPCTSTFKRAVCIPDASSGLVTCKLTMREAWSS